MNDCVLSAAELLETSRALFLSVFRFRTNSQSHGTVALSSAQVPGATSEVLSSSSLFHAALQEKWKERTWKL
jgi:hypothetical protein